MARRETPWVVEHGGLIIAAGATVGGLLGVLISILLQTYA
jgi:hypothetical protein